MWKGFQTLFALLLVWTVMSQSSLQIKFDPMKGGLISSLKTKNSDAPTVTGMTIYTDHGIIRPNRYDPIGSANEHKPIVSNQVLHGKIFVKAKGWLKETNGQSCGLSYCVRHIIADETVMIDIALKAERDFHEMNGFLAVMFSFVGATEWFAKTKDGWIFQDINSEGRVFQSNQTPLPNCNNGVVGVANAKAGWALVTKLQGCKPTEILDNVILHTLQTGSGGIFFAWCDGVRTKQMRKGEIWQLSLTLQFLPLERLLDDEAI